MEPRRIASLLASGTEILFGLGLGERVVAISHECDHPPEALDRPRVTRTRVAHEAASRAIDEQVRAMSAARQPLFEIDIERLVEVRPDLVVTQSQCEVCAINAADVCAALEGHAALAGVVVALNPVSFEAIFEDIERVGQAAGVPERSAEWIARLRGRVAAVQERAAALQGDRPRVVCLEWIDPPMVAANWMPTLVELAGGACTLTQAGQRSGYTAWERVVEYDPQVIVVMPCGFDLARSRREAAVLRKFPGWNDIRAVRDDRVYAVDGNGYFNRSGPRIVDSLEILASLIHPELFAEHAGSYGSAWKSLAP